MSAIRRLLIIAFTIYLIPSLSFSLEKKYDLVATGKAMVDLIQYVSDDELNQIMPVGFKKADSTRINEATADEIEKKMQDIIFIPGGSEANVAADFGSLGGTAAFNAIMADDKLGKLFKRSLEKEHVEFLSLFTEDQSLHTARCFTFITSDRERTFAVAAEITSEINDWFINYNAIKNSKVFYTDASNLNHGGNQSKVTVKSIDIAKANNVSVAFGLNNNHYVETYRDEIISLLPKVDIFFGSEKEAKNLFKVKTVDKAIDQYLKYVKIAVITLGKKGAVIATKDQKIYVASAVDDKKIVDLNGAGDGFTAGFLYGYTHGYDLEKSGKLASQTAAEIIYQIGARPKNNLKQALLGEF